MRVDEKNPQTGLRSQQQEATPVACPHSYLALAATRALWLKNLEAERLIPKARLTIIINQSLSIVLEIKVAAGVDEGERLEEAQATPAWKCLGQPQLQHVSVDNELSPPMTGQQD